MLSKTPGILFDISRNTFERIFVPRGTAKFRIAVRKRNGGRRQQNYKKPTGKKTFSDFSVFEMTENLCYN